MSETMENHFRQSLLLNQLIESTVDNLPLNRLIEEKGLPKVVFHRDVYKRQDIDRKGLWCDIFEQAYRQFQ